MTPFEFLILLVVAAISGGIGQKLAGHGKGGCLTHIALGFIGALIGPRLQDVFDLPELWVVEVGGESFPVIWSIIGAAVFVAMLGFLTGRKKD